MQIEDGEKARRLARTIVSDIALYNRDEIRKGLREDNIFELLAEELERGRKLYASRVSPDIQRRVNHYNQAIVDILIKQYGSTIQSPIW